MKVVVLLCLVSMMVAYSLAQMTGATQPQGSPPNFLQMMLMRNMLDLNWLPMMYYMSAMGNNNAGGAGGAGSLYPLLFLGNM